MRILLPILFLCTSPVFANTFDRPIPQSQSATAEMWFAIASLALIAALALVHHLVMRK
jgi:hypothetical protein